MRFVQVLPLALAAAFLSSCGKSGSSPENATGSSSGTPVTAPRPGAPIEIATASGIEMVYLPGGEFAMGADNGNPDEAPAHKVKLTPFAIDKYEVCQEMFEKVQLPNPSHWNENPKKPVERVRWRDAKQYCNERSVLEKLKPVYNEKTADWDPDFSASGYRLPTEAEWEYACKAGTDAAFDFGQSDKLRQFAWFADNAEEKTHAIAQKKPNRWGIYDLYGNVSEWCEDVYSPTYYKESPGVDPAGPPSPRKDVKRVMRGGSWKSSAEMCRSTFRQGQKTGDTDACFYTDYCGFRCVRRISSEEVEKLRAKSR
ncbi:MAG TPA: formylglycine-generating enzyme family protein [Verrucomicrobiae bacterium]|nr:formylglycine-generating enzyme family protein [Verrucomicrobiae bacterium]